MSEVVRWTMFISGHYDHEHIPLFGLMLYEHKPRKYISSLIMISAKGYTHTHTHVHTNKRPTINYICSTGYQQKCKERERETERVHATYI